MEPDLICRGEHAMDLAKYEEGTLKKCALGLRVYCEKRPMQHKN